MPWTLRVCLPVAGRSSRLEVAATLARRLGFLGGEEVLAEATEAYRVAFGERLVSAYALGSLAHGGFSPLVSDVDLGLVIRDPLGWRDAARIAAVARRERFGHSSLHERLSVFWGTPTTLRGEATRRGGRFPALDRWDLIEHGRLLAGNDDVRRGLPPPSPGQLLVAGAEFALRRFAATRESGSLAARMRSIRGPSPIEEIRSPELVFPRDLRSATRLVLFPVRSLYTATTGRVDSNGAAVASYLDDRHAPSHRLVAAALAWRTVPPPEHAAASELMREELLPLYLHYIDDHIRRLDSLAEAKLSGGFRGWRDRLVR